MFELLTTLQVRKELTRIDSIFERENIPYSSGSPSDHRGPAKIKPLELESPREDDVLVRVVASGIS